MPTSSILDQITFRNAFECDTSLQKYRKNAFLLFALALYLRIEDIDEFAAASLTDGPDDKKVDICFVDLNEGRAVISQGYLAQNWGKESAPANKASDLNTAVAWLLSANEEAIPKHLRAKAIELRRAVTEGQMQRIELLYVHNCAESQNVNDELKVVATAASDILRSSGAGQITVSYRELGLESIEELFRSRDRDILIEQWMDVPGKGLMKQSGRGWTAIVTSVSGDWIRGLYEHNQDRLFSANFRDYLGAVERKGNINFGIKQTASAEPDNFWVYNNGVTAITNELQAKRGKIRIRGISIINGAQTSGALGETLGSQVGKTSVLCRIVQCTDPALVDRIIRYNNTQNEIRPADARSNDPVQTRIKQDFVKYEIPYLHRRSAIRSPRNAISAATLAPWLCAFHGDHQTASRNAREIFNNDSVYNRVFPTNISVEHVFLVAALAAAIDNYKFGLRIRIGESRATELQVKQYEVLKYAMSKNFVLLVVGLAAEEIMQMKVADLYEWKCKPDVIRPDAAAMVEVWDAALQALMPQVANLTGQVGSAYDVTRSSEGAKKVATNLTALLASLEPTLGAQFGELRNCTVA